MSTELSDKIDAQLDKLVDTLSKGIRERLRQAVQDVMPRTIADEMAPTGKLTAEDARAIFSSESSIPKLARQYGVSEVTIGNVRNRRSWAEATWDLVPGCRLVRQGGEE